MIEIEHINRTSFPTIDFTFVNRGSAAAVLWQIGLEITSLTIDTTPALRFYQEAEKERLKIIASNTGWGPARLSRIQLSSPTIPLRQHIVCDRLSATESDVLIGYLSADTQQFDAWKDKRRNICASLQGRLNSIDVSTIGSADLKKFFSPREWWHISECGNAVAHGNERTADPMRWHIECLSKMPQDSIPVPQINISCAAQDNTGREHTILCDASAGDGQIWLSNRGFEFKREPPAMAAMMAPTMRMACLVGTDHNNSERKYRVSAKTQPGDAEKFQITVGADKSCFIEALFKFYFDAKYTVTSDRFKLHICRPYGSYISEEDGDQFIPTDRGWRLADRSGHITRRM
jgi:hypothetical protein